MTDDNRKKILERLNVIHNMATLMTECHENCKSNNILNYEKLFTFSISEEADKSMEALNKVTIDDVEGCNLSKYEGEVEFKYSEYEYNILKDGISLIIGSFGTNEFQKIIQDVLNNGFESMYYNDSLLIKESYLTAISLFIIHIEVFKYYEELIHIKDYLVGIYVYTKSNSLDVKDTNVYLSRDVIYNDGEFVFLNTLNIEGFDNIEKILLDSMGENEYGELWDKYLVSSNNTNSDINKRLKESIKKEVETIKEYGLVIDNIDKFLSISIDDVAMCDGHYSNLLFIAGLLDSSLSNKSLITIELYTHLVDKLDDYYIDCAIDGDSDNFDILFHDIYKYVVKRKFNLPTIELSKPLVGDEEYLDTLAIDNISILGIFLAKFRDQKILSLLKEESEKIDEPVAIEEVLNIVTKYKLNLNECRDELDSVKGLTDDIEGLDFSRLERYLEDAIKSFNSVGFPIKSDMMVEKLLEDIEGKEAKDKYLSFLIKHFNKH